MGTLTQLLEKLAGKIHFYVYVGDRVAVEVIIKEEKNVVVDIKNPILALELGMDAMLKKKGGGGSGTLKKLKAMGYKIKIKYKGFEFSL